MHEGQGFSQHRVDVLQRQQLLIGYHLSSGHVVETSVECLLLDSVTISFYFPLDPTSVLNLHGTEGKCHQRHQIHARADDLELPAVGALHYNVCPSVKHKPIRIAQICDLVFRVGNALG